jgi:hypothetical protein
LRRNDGGEREDAGVYELSEVSMMMYFLESEWNWKVNWRERWRTWYCAAVPQFPIRAGSAMRFLRPWAPNAPSMTLEAPKRVPIVQKGGIMCEK